MRFVTTCLKSAKATVQAFIADQAMVFAAAISFYAIISLAPLLVIVVAVAGIVYGEKAVTGEITGQIEAVVGQEGASVVEMILSNASGPGSGTAAIVSSAILLFSASAVFTQLTNALNVIFGTKPKHKGPVSFLLGKLTAIAFVLGVGVFVMLSLASGALVSRLQDLVVQLTPGLASAGRWVEWFTMVLLFTWVFALVFRILPAEKVKGRPLLVGSLVTSVLFNVGRFAAGTYLSHSAVGSSYGAAGSLLVLLMWIYYSAITVMLGAEFTKIFIGNREAAAPEKA
jgi:membrane protein